MKIQSSKSNIFLVSVLMYIMFEKVFYILFSLNNIIMFKINTNNNLYFLGFILSAISSLIVMFFLYRFFIKQTVYDKKFLIKVLILFIVVLLVYFGLNRYSGILSETSTNQETFLKLTTYYSYVDIIYFITSAILLLVFFIAPSSRKSNN